MDSPDIRQKFLDFFAKRDHVIVPSSSLIPDDPSVLLTTAGMQQFKPYYTGDADPMATIHPALGAPLGSKNAVSIQKSFRTSDIDEVGDERHLTFFEMMGNFSFGGYFKKEAIVSAFDFLTREMGLAISYVTIFQGAEHIGVPADDESRAIWQSMGVTDIRQEGMEDVFWGPTGSAGPCGPTTEIYCKNGAGEDIEVWNIVFNEFFFPGSREELLSGGSEKKLEPLKIPGVDTGMGLERLVMCVHKTKNIFETDLFASLMTRLPPALGIKQKRVIADHLRAASFLLAGGVRPSNKDRGYILRRLLRRALAYEYQAGLSPDIFESVIIGVITGYGGFYQELASSKDNSINEYWREREKFLKTLGNGIKEFQRAKANGPISALVAFWLYQTFGITFEVIKELDPEATGLLTRTDFDLEYAKHQELSRAGAEAKFGGHGLYMKTGEVTIRDESEVDKVTRLHTATHLMHAALRAVLGPEVRQDGSDITVDRTRFDFRFGRKLTPDELRQVEEWVNDAIKKDLAVTWREMPYAEAVAQGALGFFHEKYPLRVKVYSVFDLRTGEVCSKELCGGPHVEHTGLIGVFKITKEESSSAGVRRIRAVLAQ